MQSSGGSFASLRWSSAAPAVAESTVSHSFRLLLSPYRNLGRLPPVVIKPDDPTPGLIQDEPFGPRDRIPGQSFIASEQEWFGIRILLLTSQTFSKLALCIKAFPTVYAFLLEDRKCRVRPVLGADIVTLFY